VNTGLTPLRNTDVPVSPSNHDINRRDSNLSLFDGLFRKIYRHVRHNSIPVFRRSLDWCHRSAIISDKLHPIDFITSKSNWDPAQPVVLELVGEAEHHKTFEQYLTSQKASSINADGSSRDNPAGQELDYGVDLESVAESRTLAPQQ
jgi:hypothetical protein